MKKTLLILFVCTLFFSCKVKKYQASDFNSKTNSHKTIAILPPVIFYSSPNAGTLNIFKDKEEQIKNESNSLHQHIYNQILAQTNKKKPVKIGFQDINKTNSILRSAAITQKELKEKSPEELAKLLGVDAVMVNKVEKVLLVDDKLLAMYGVGKEIVDLIKLNLPNAPASPVNTGFVKIGDMKMSSTINDAKDGYMLWRAWKDFEISLDDLPDDISIRYGNQCAKAFPYRGK